MKRFMLIALLVVLAGAGYWIVIPSPINAAAWTPPPEPAMEGPWEPDSRLKQAVLIAKGEIHGPEDIAVSRDGHIYTGTEGGWIVRIFPHGEVEQWVNTGGRPLGMKFDDTGNLIVADAWKGLLSVAPDGTVSVLAMGVNGVPFGFTDDLDIAADGTIYFSDASSRFHQPEYKLDLLEARPHGRLLKYEPDTGEVTLLASDLYFANGVAVDPAERFVLVNETWRYRVMRYWLEGEKAGQIEVFAGNLPGFPDNLARDQAGRFWVALPTLRNATVDDVHPYPWIKNLIAKLPDFAQPQPQPYGLVAVLSPDGDVLASLHDTDGQHLREITSVEPANGLLYFGSLSNDRIGRLSLAEIPGLDNGPAAAAPGVSQN